MPKAGRDRIQQIVLVASGLVFLEGTRFIGDVPTMLTTPLERA